MEETFNELKQANSKELKVMDFGCISYILGKKYRNNLKEYLYPKEVCEGESREVEHHQLQCYRRTYFNEFETVKSK